ncbi:MAG: ATP-binding protein [Scytonema sp. PMC 1069.18]|nr:ATP-binding protein [Scytonema sp. PMC 1069.18]MEC4881802.1 ATP-binding protein [Scytonema sp. PMC 1070.18]
MTLNPKPRTIRHPRGHPLEFEQVLEAKNQNFVGREFVFTAISNFSLHYNRGYFTIVGVPGSGKSAILANYVRENSHILYYNAQVQSKHLAEEFLVTICSQLINQYPLHISLPDKATEGSWFLSLLLQKISDQLQSHQKLIIAIDALDVVDYKNQSSGSNIFYLPRYLPDGVYFILTRRPFLREKSGLLIETPSQTLNLSEFSKQNREDVQRYIQQYLISRSLLTEKGVESWEGLHISKEEFIARLMTESESNFMYLNQILLAIAEGFYSESWQHHRLPPGLEAYYQQHWEKMTTEGLSDIALKVLLVLTSVKQAEGVLVDAIAQIINEDEYNVEEVLENWFEFLQQQEVDGEVRYSLYHSSFRLWLVQQISNL